MSSSSSASGKSKEKARDVNAAMRAEKAMQLRELGATYQQVAQQCGYGSRAAAYHAVQRELARTLQEPADALRQLEVSRLDALYRAMVSKALAGDKDSTWYVDRCLAIMERRARLLGLDIPVPPAVVPLSNVRRVYERR